MEIPPHTRTGNYSSIGEEPVSHSKPHSTSIRRSATSRLVSYAEQGSIIFTNVLQHHITVVLVCYISEWEPDITCTWEGRDTILYMYCTGGTEIPQSHTQQPISMCWFLVTTSLFTSFYFCLKTSKLSLFQRDARSCIHLTGILYHTTVDSGYQAHIHYLAHTAY